MTTDVDKFKSIDSNFIHIVVDRYDAGGYFHASSVVKKILEDIRMDSYNFEVKTYSKEEVFIPEYIGSSKKTIKDFEGKSVISNRFLEKVGTGDLIIVAGGEKILNGFFELTTQNDEAFFYFASTKKIPNFKKEKTNFDILTIEKNSLTLEERDDDNVISIREDTIFEYTDFKIMEEKKSDKNYTFAVINFSSQKQKNQLCDYRGENIIEKVENLLKALKKFYRENSKIVIISNLNNELDIKVEKAFKQLIWQKLKKNDIKIKFLYHDYISNNKMHNVISHLMFNSGNNVIFPCGHKSEIYSFASFGVPKENIFWYKSAHKKNEIFTANCGELTEGIFNALNELKYFNEEEITNLKQYKSEEIQDTLVLNYISNTIISAYLDDTQNRDVKNELLEEEEIEEDELESENQDLETGGKEEDEIAEDLEDVIKAQKKLNQKDLEKEGEDLSEGEEEGKKSKKRKEAEEVEESEIEVSTNEKFDESEPEKLDNSPDNNSFDDNSLDDNSVDDSSPDDNSVDDNSPDDVNTDKSSKESSSNTEVDIQNVDNSSSESKINLNQEEAKEGKKVQEVKKQEAGINL